MDKLLKCLWVKIRGQISMGDIVCYKLPDQEEVANIPLRHLKCHGSFSQSLVVIGSLSHQVICWKSNIDEHKRSRRLLECSNDKLLT